MRGTKLLLICGKVSSTRVGAMTDRRVEQFLQDNSELNYIDKDVFEGCFYKIQSWIDIQVLLPYLMRYHLVTSDDRDYLTNPYKTAVDKSFHLVAVAEKGGRHGYMLLYICILESAKETQGHVDAVKELDEMGKPQALQAAIYASIAWKVWNGY